MTEPKEPAAGKRVIAMARFDVVIASSNRPASLSVPADCSEAELFELVGWITTAVRNAIVEEAAKRASSIILPGRLI